MVSHTLQQVIINAKLALGDSTDALREAEANNFPHDVRQLISGAIASAHNLRSFSQRAIDMLEARAGTQTAPQFTWEEISAAIAEYIQRRKRAQS